MPFGTFSGALMNAMHECAPYVQYKANAAATEMERSGIEVQEHGERGDNKKDEQMRPVRAV